MQAGLRVFAAVVFGWQLWGAGRTFVLPRGERLGPRHQLMPMTFILTMALSLGAPVRPGLVVPGCAGLLGAVVLFEWARRSIRGRFFSYVYSRDEPGFLWTGGPFAYIRNPFYTSYLLSALSVTLMFENVITIMLWILLVWFTHSAARHEERKFMASPLREDYQAYAAGTGRFIPGVGLLKRED